MSKDVSLDKIRIDGGTQIRVKINDEKVAEYREALDNGVEFPPCVAYFDGTDYWLADGFHRFHAYREAGRETLPCLTPTGRLRDAILHACGANAEHGLNRTNADKRKAVKTLLADAEWSQNSDRWIADQAKVDHKLVAKVRSELESTGDIPSCKTRTGKDGKSRRKPANGKADRSKPPSGKSLQQDGQTVGQTSDEPEGYGKCPACAGSKWIEDEFGVSCVKCNHPHGEPAGDVDDDRLKTQRSKTVKTTEALMRAFDDLQMIKAKPVHGEAIQGCKKLLGVAKGWK